MSRDYSCTVGLFFKMTCLRVLLTNTLVMSEMFSSSRKLTPGVSSAGRVLISSMFRWCGGHTLYCNTHVLLV